MGLGLNTVFGLFVSHGRLLLSAVAVLGVVLTALSTMPEILLFRERLALSIFELESDVELQPIDLVTHDGLVLRSWYHPPRSGKPVIVYFPGRVGDVIKKPRHLFSLAEEGYGLMLAGYRGYGGNPGRPSEDRFYRDATRLLEKVADNRLAPNGIILYGYSMGTGITSYIAAHTKPVGVVLEAPFTSFRDIVGHNARQMPLWLVRSRFDTRSRYGAIDAPILLLAGERDTVTPASFATLLASANERLSQLHIFPEASHDDMFEHGAWEAISGFLGGLQELAVVPAAAMDAVEPLLD